MSTRRLHIVPLPSFREMDFESSTASGLRYAIFRAVNCWHLRLGRPTTQGRETYRACLRCGMRRRFDLQTWKCIGRYYSPDVERRN